MCPLSRLHLARSQSLQSLPPSAEVTWFPSQKEGLRQFRFLDLPRELRDRIYEVCLQVEGVILIFPSGSYIHHPPKAQAKIIKYKNIGPDEPQPAESVLLLTLLRTCRQLHTESVSVLYSRNTFRLFMTNIDFGSKYRLLLRRIIFTTEPDIRMYSNNNEAVDYWWRRRFWPDVLDRSVELLEKFPNLKTLTFPIKSNRLGETWKPTFFAVEQKTRDQRVDIAARWMKARCRLHDERLRRCLHLELVPGSAVAKERSWLFPEEDQDEWDFNEFADAFEKAKVL